MDSIIKVRDLVVRKGDDPLTFDISRGLTLMVTGRETGASTTCMALAGRFNQKNGEIDVGGDTKARQRFKQVALAGVTLIDSLERQVTVRQVLRDQIAWGQHFFKPVPRDVLGHKWVTPWLKPLKLEGLDVKQEVGALGVADRFRLRVLLALVSRPDAVALIVDDIDQIRSVQLRQELLGDMQALSAHIPVVVGTVNEDPGNHADHIVDLREPGDDGAHTETAEDIDDAHATARIIRHGQPHAEQPKQREVGA